MILPLFAKRAETERRRRALPMNADRRQRHGGGSDDGRQQQAEDWKVESNAGHADRHAGGVVNEMQRTGILAGYCPSLACDDRRAMTIPRMLASQQGDAGALNGDGNRLSSSHRDADIGVAASCRGVADAIASHFMATVRPLFARSSTWDDLALCPQGGLQRIDSGDAELKCARPRRPSCGCRR